VLCRNPDRVLTPQELVQAIRGYSVETWEAKDVIRPHISNLRRKLTSAAPEADIIGTVRSVGYILRVPIPI
jgi:DNA-binding response OmpR family regulator